MSRLLRFLIITATLLCHFHSSRLLAQVGDTAGTAVPLDEPQAASTAPPSPQHDRGASRLTGRTLQPGGNATIQAREFTVTGHTYVASGDVEIDYGNVALRADRITYNGDTATAIADGHVAFDDIDEQTHIEGTRATYNFRQSAGEFDNFQGTSGVRTRGREVTLLSSNPLIFHGRRLMRLGPTKYRVEHGTITSCRLPRPKWTLSANRVDFELGENASLRSAVFHVYEVPVFYAPYLTHSTRRQGRHSGFLLPDLGRSTRKGTVLGDAFFWAINRSAGATFGADYYSLRGWADHLNFDTLPSENSKLSGSLDGVFDRGISGPETVYCSGAAGQPPCSATPGPNTTPQQVTLCCLKQGGQEAQLIGSNQDLWGFRAGINAAYLSSFVYRLAFKETFAEAINSEVASTAFLEKQRNGYDLSLITHRYQNFLCAPLSTATTSTLTCGSLGHSSIQLATVPGVAFSSYARPAQHLPLYLSWDTNFSELDRTQPFFGTGLMSRADFSPRVTLPVQTAVGSLSLAVSGRSTYYTERLSNAGSIASPALMLQPNQSLTRSSGSVDFIWDLPSIERMFSTSGFLGERVKHVIEPEIAFHETDGVHDADEIIRFDDRDVLTDTRELDYSLTQRLFGRLRKTSSAREFISWTLRQKYFFDPNFGGALVPGARNQFLTTAELTPFAFAFVANTLSPVSSVFRVSPVAGFDGDWRLDIDARAHQIHDSAFTGTFHFGRGFFQGSQFLVRLPATFGLLAPSQVPRAKVLSQQTSFDQLHFSTGYGNAARSGLSVALAAAYDEKLGFLQYGSVQTTYNWDCCGLSLLYRRFSLRLPEQLATLRNENQFRLSFTLANVGSFGNLRRQERIIY